MDLAYKVVKNNLSFDLTELLLNQLNKNMDSIWSSKNNPCKFGSFLTCLFFYVQKLFPSKGTIEWRKDVLVFYQINEYIAEMGENFDSIMDSYFDTIKEKMNNRFSRSSTMSKDRLFFTTLYAKSTASHETLFGWLEL